VAKPRSEIKEKIIKVLAEHPEGLTIQKISELVGTTRITAAKYIAELAGAGIVYRRRVGVATLCYLKEKYVSLVREGEILELLRKKLKKV